MSDKRHNNKKNCFKDTTIKETRKGNSHTLRCSELKLRKPTISIDLIGIKKPNFFHFPDNDGHSRR
jgi:hypothetical protein